MLIFLLLWLSDATLEFDTYQQIPLYLKKNVFGNSISWQQIITQNFKNGMQKCYKTVLLLPLKPGKSLIQIKNYSGSVLYVLNFPSNRI